MICSIFSSGDAVIGICGSVTTPSTRGEIKGTNIQPWISQVGIEGHRVDLYTQEGHCSDTQTDQGIGWECDFRRNDENFREGNRGRRIN
jgi:hypothetical protein